VGLTFEQVLGRLDGVRRSGSGKAVARCPAHDDRRASLSIATGRKGGYVLRCHAGTGCPVDAILEAAGLAWADILPEAPKGRGQIDRVYQYRDENGVVLRELVRFKPKAFAWRLPSGDWSKGQKVRRVLYRLPELLAADREAPVFFTEGEKDADSLARLGLVSTTSGSAESWRRNLVEHLRGRRVVILPDANDVGRSFGRRVAAALRLAARSVRVLELPGLPEGGDVTDWIAAGGTPAELIRLAESASPGAVPDPRPPLVSEETVERIVRAVEVGEPFHSQKYFGQANILVGLAVEGDPVVEGLIDFYLEGACTCRDLTGVRLWKRPCLHFRAGKQSKYARLIEAARVFQGQDFDPFGLNSYDLAKTIGGLLFLARLEARGVGILRKSVVAGVPLPYGFSPLRNYKGAGGGGFRANTGRENCDSGTSGPRAEAGGFAPIQAESKRGGSGQYRPSDSPFPGAPVDPVASVSPANLPAQRDTGPAVVANGGLFAPDLGLGAATLPLAEKVQREAERDAGGVR